MASLPRILIKVLVAVAVLAAAAVLTVFIASSSHLNRRYAVAPEPVAIAAGPEAIARGRHIAVIRGCVACHGDDLGGALVLDNGAMGVVYGPNLTTGAGGVGARLSAVDWVRAVRHGVASDGHPLFIMPSGDYTQLSDQDLGELLAYATRVPPVDRTVPEIKVGPVARVLLTLGKMRLSAEKIDHGRLGAVAAVKAETSAAYGRYLAQTCSGCHNPAYSGGKIAEGPPDWPAAANLTPGADLKNWSQADFINALRSGRRPDGTEISPVMPRVFSQMSDPELQAIWLYLQTVPPRPTGSS